jgi:hypothetical protein
MHFMQVERTRAHARNELTFERSSHACMHACIHARPLARTHLLLHGVVVGVLTVTARRHLAEWQRCHGVDGAEQGLLGHRQQARRTSLV